MTTIEDVAGLANRIRPVVQVLGGKFMTSPELAEVEAEVGLQPRSLYVRGRSAVLGDVPPKGAAELFGIFPHWLFDFVLPPAMAAGRSRTASAGRSRKAPRPPSAGRRRAPPTVPGRTANAAAARPRPRPPPARGRS